MKLDQSEVQIQLQSHVPHSHCIHNLRISGVAASAAYVLEIPTLKHQPCHIIERPHSLCWHSKRSPPWCGWTLVNSVWNSKRSLGKWADLSVLMQEHGAVFEKCRKENLMYFPLHLVPFKAVPGSSIKAIKSQNGSMLVNPLKHGIDKQCWCNPLVIVHLHTHRSTHTNFQQHHSWNTNTHTHTHSCRRSCEESGTKHWADVSHLWNTPEEQQSTDLKSQGPVLQNSHNLALPDRCYYQGCDWFI